MFPKPVFEDIQKSNKKRNDAANSTISPKVDYPPSDNPPSDNQPLSNNDSTNNNNINNELELEEEEEEEKLIYIEQADNVVFEVLKEELHDRAVSDVTINKIIRLMHTRNLDMYQLDYLAVYAFYDWTNDSDQTKKLILKILKKEFFLIFLKIQNCAVS